MLLGDPALAPGAEAPRLLFVKARIQDHDGEASAPAQGPMVLGAVARERGWDVRCLDTYLVRDAEQALRDALREFPADVIGLSALTAEFRSMHALARVARDMRPDALILAGGAHPSADADDTLSNEAIDAAVLHEGERTLEEVLDHFLAGTSWRGIAGLAFRGDDGVVHRGPERAYIEDLDVLPLPAWDLTDIDAYAKRRGMSLAGLRRYMPITTSRGCPYKCTYCHDIQGKRFRSHSPEYVLAMVDALREQWNVYDFDITDDIFNFDPQRMMTICDGFIERGDVRYTCPNGIRADRMTVEQADKMARAGAQYVAIAIETATKRLQKQIKKHLRFDKVLPVIEAFTERDVFTSGFFMVGFPGETEEELQATVDYAVGSKLHAAYFFVVTPFAGTGMHEDVVQDMGEAATALTGSGFFFRPVHNLSDVPDERFYAIRRSAYLRFYLDPRRVRRMLRAHPRKKDIFEYATLMFVRDALRIEPGRLLEPIARVRNRLGIASRGGGDGERQAPVAPQMPLPPVIARARARARSEALANGTRRQLPLA